MKSKILSITFCLFVIALPAFAQNKEARQIDEFGRLPCGDFESRMQNISIEFQNFPDSKIYIVYYGSRFRKENVWSEKTKGLDKIKLTYSHREDGLNWAKSIPLYLTTEETYPAAVRSSLKDKISLVNGGFRENIGVEIWLVPTNIELPKPTPDVAENDIKFRKDKPIKTPDYTRCYE